MCFFSFAFASCGGGLNLTSCVLWARHLGVRANNLRPKLKQLSVVLTTVDTTKQGVGEVSLWATINNYAACAVGHDTAMPCSNFVSYFPLWVSRITTLRIEIWKTQASPVRVPAVSHTSKYGKRLLCLADGTTTKNDKDYFIWHARGVLFFFVFYEVVLPYHNLQDEGNGRARWKQLSEVFAAAKVKLLCSEVCATHKWS